MVIDIPVLLLIGVYIPALFLIGIICFLLGCQVVYREGESDRRDLAYYRRTYLTKSGFTTFHGEGINYSLISIDAGKTWYATNQEREILGLAEVIHPGLLKHVQGTSELMAYVLKHGPLDLGNVKDMALLKGAGFTVQGGDTGRK